MKLANGIRKFARTPLEGWDHATGTWVPNVAKGNFMTFDRFISDRSFGQNKRIFMTPVAMTIPPEFSIVRVGGEEIFLVESLNRDIMQDREGGAYSHIFQLREAPFPARVINFSGAVLASGQKGPRVEVASQLTFIAAERYAFDAMTVIDGAKVARDQLYVAGELTMDVESEIQVEGATRRWAVEEVSTMLKLQFARGRVLKS